MIRLTSPAAQTAVNHALGLRAIALSGTTAASKNHITTFWYFGVAS